MTSTPANTPDSPLEGSDDARAVLDFAREQIVEEERAARSLMLAAAKFAAMCSGQSLVGPVASWHERSLPLGGEGCPEVAEFAVMEFAAAMGRSPASGRHYLAQVVEASYRLPRCWARFVAGRLPAWRVRFIAERTMCLSPAAAAFVDHHVAAVAHSVGPAQLARLIEEAKARFDPAQAEADRAAAAEARRFDVELEQVSSDGTVHVEGDLDLADAFDLDTAVAVGARARAELGSTESLAVRRSQALGDMARAQLAFGFESGPGATRARAATKDMLGDEDDLAGPAPATRAATGSAARPLVLHAHIAAEAVRGFTAGGNASGTDLARLEECVQALTAEQIRLWCGNPEAHVTVQPVIDLAEHIHVMSYEAPDRLKAQIALRDVTCSHPWCTRPAVSCDCEHRVPHRRDDPSAGPTCSCNLAPSCRPHHRAKTTGGWSYVTVEPGVYLWRSPLGYQYLRDARGTVDVTPDDDRRRYARELLAHFGDQPPEP